MGFVIIGYDIINGSKQYHKVKHKKVETIADINFFEKQVKHGYKQINQIVDVYAVYISDTKIKR